MEKINQTQAFNFRVVNDPDITALLDLFPFEEVTWHESSPASENIYKDQKMAEVLLNAASGIILSKYIPGEIVDCNYARAWRGKTADGTNREYHSDKVWEQRDPNLNRPVSNHIALYYRCDLAASKAGGLKFWNRVTGDKLEYMPSFGDIVLIDERADDVYHKVINHDPTLVRLVVGFGYWIS